jgi:prolyl-tRNA synthetase
VGPRDLAEGRVTIVRRDTGDKQTVGLDAVASVVPALVAEVGRSLFAEATARRDASIRDVTTIESAAEAAEEGWARIPYPVLLAGDGEARLRAQAVTVRCLRRPDGTLPLSEDEPDTLAYLAKAY